MNGPTHTQEPQGEPNYTVDGILIVEGLRVFTNNLDRGTVGAEHKWNPGWYDVKLDHDYKGQPTIGTVMMNGERMATLFEDKEA